jgi:hypothetical protein
VGNFQPPLLGRIHPALTAVIAALAKGSIVMAYVPAAIALISSISSGVSRFYALSSGSAGRDTNKLVHQLAEASYESRRLGDQITLSLRYETDPSLVRKIINQSNGLARKVNEDLYPFIVTH